METCYWPTLETRAQTTSFREAASPGLEVPARSMPWNGMIVVEARGNEGPDAMNFLTASPTNIQCRPKTSIAGHLRSHNGTYFELSCPTCLPAVIVSL